MIHKDYINNRTLWTWEYNTKKLAILGFLYWGSRNYAPINAFTCSEIHAEVKLNDNQQLARTYTALQGLIRFGLVRRIVSNLSGRYLHQITKTGRDKYKELRDRKEMRLTTGVHVSLWIEDWPPHPLPSLHKFVKNRVHGCGSNASTWRLPDDERLALYVPVRREYFEDRSYQILNFYRCGGDVSPYQDLLWMELPPVDSMVEPTAARRQIAQDAV